MKLIPIFIISLVISSCEGYFFLSGSADSGQVSLSSLLGQTNDLQSNPSPIIGSLAINLSAALEAEGVDEAKISHILQSAALASQDSKNAVAAAKAFLGGAVGALQTSNEQIQTLSLTDDTTDLLDLSATIMDSSYKTTGTYLAEHGNTGATNSKVDDALINTAMEGMATETLSQLKTIIPATKLKEAVKTVMNTTSSNASSMHNKTELAVSESQNAFKSVMQGIFTAAKEIKELNVEDVADAVVSTLAVVIKKQNIGSNDAATLVVGMSSAIVTAVASDKDIADKSSVVALKVLDIGIQSLVTAGVDKTILATGVGNLVQNVTTVAISNASKSDTDLVKKIATASQKSAAIVANSTGLDVADLSKSASQATKKAIFAANTEATSDELAAISAQINEGEKKGLADSKVVNAAILNSIAVNNQNDTAAIIKSVTVKPTPTPAPPSSGGGSGVVIAPTPNPSAPILGPAHSYMFFIGSDGSGNYNSLYRTDGTAPGTMMLLSQPNDVSNIRLITKGAHTWFQDSKIPIAANKFFFNAMNKLNGIWQLWVTEGIAGSTFPIADSTFVNDFAIVRDLYFFSSQIDSAYGAELFVSNGTAAGTKRVVSAARSNSFTHVSQMMPCHGFLYFVSVDMISNNNYGYGTLSRTDGTDTGTILLTMPTAPGIHISSLECAAGSLYMTMASTNSDGTASQTLWRTSDGIGFQQIEDNDWVYSGLTQMGNRLIGKGTYYAYPENIHDNELVILSLSASPPAFQPITFKWDVSRTSGLFFEPQYGASPQMLSVLNGVAYFQGNSYDPDNSYSNNYLFMTNGTESGTVRVTIDNDHKPLRINELKAFSNMVVMNGDDSCSGLELYAARRTTTPGQNTSIARININTPSADPASTNMNPDCAYEQPYSSSPSRFIEAGGKVYFAAMSNTAGTELFVTDGTAAGTRMVIDLFPGPSSGYYNNY